MSMQIAAPLFRRGRLTDSPEWLIFQRLSLGLRVMGQGAACREMARELFCWTCRTFLIFPKLI